MTQQVEMEAGTPKLGMDTDAGDSWNDRDDAILSYAVMEHVLQA